MGRQMMILVCDSAMSVENAKSFAVSNGWTVEVYTSAEWQSRQHGAVSHGGGAKILPFPSTTGTSTNGDFKVQTINELEAKAIEGAIFEFNGNLTEAAKALGIGRATLYRKVKQYNLDPGKARKKRMAA